MGELHLDIIVDRLVREFGVAARVGRPEVSYRETILRPAQAEAKYVRQSGGRGQYGHVELQIVPREDHTGFTFKDATRGGVVPGEFLPDIEAGVREAMSAGTQGFPVIGVDVFLVNGSAHEVDSSPIAFRIAAAMAFRNATAKATPVLLEPMMLVEIVIPEEYLGEVLADVSQRRGSITDLNQVSGARTIIATVPLAAMFGYATDLRSLTQGRGTFTMQFTRYNLLPPGTGPAAGERSSR
jgi:elongation factor G